VHQVGSKDFGSQNFSFLALKAEPVGEVQILRMATATARDRRKILIAQIMFFSHKKSQNVKIGNKKISFFSSRNQYPHIPYVASKNWQILNYRQTDFWYFEEYKMP
jgi:hypothetical protein